MLRLNFTESNHPVLDWGYEVYNSSGQNICAIRKVRIGRFMHWSMVVEFYHLVDELNHIWFSPGCQDEIRAECKRLNGMKLREDKKCKTLKEPLKKLATR